MNRQTFLDSFGHVADAPGGIGKLRRLILDLAVRGALVEQDRADEPSTRMIERIAEERARLVEAKEIRAPKPLGEVPEKDKPYGLPDGWSWVWLSDVLLKLTDGTHHSPPNGPSGEYPYVSARNVKDGYMLLDELTFVSAEHHEEIWARCDPRPGDVLFVKDGATTGNAALVELHEPFSMLSSVAQLRPGPGLNDRYLLIAMRSPTVRSELRGGMKGSAITRTTLTKLGRVVLPIPPSTEQLRIVERVEELMALCDELQEQQVVRAEARTTLTAATLHRVVASDAADDLHMAVSSFAERIDLHLAPGDGDVVALDDFRKTILELAFRGRLSSPGPADRPAQMCIEEAMGSRERWTEPSAPAKYSRKDSGFPLGESRLPTTWAYSRLGEVLQLVNGRAYKKSEWRKAGTPVIRIQNLNGGDDYYFSDLALKPHNYCDAGDLLFAWSASFGPYLWSGERAIFHYHIWKVVTSPAISKQYAYYLLDAMTAAVKSASHGLAMLHMTKETMEGLVCPIPPIEEQHRIVERVDQLMALCDELEQQFLAAKSMRGDLAASVVAQVPGVPVDAA